MRRKLLSCIILSLLLTIGACNKPDVPKIVPTGTPVPTATLAPTNTPVPTTTLTPTSTPVPTATLTPTGTPVPTSTPTPVPTSTPTPVPTNTPTPVPTNTPTPVPTNTPTPVPTSTPTPVPTNTPTPVPTSTPTPVPTNTPTPVPTITPTPVPTNTPTPVPTGTPVPTPVASDKLPEVIYKENTILNETLLSSEEEVNRHIFSKALGNYYKFGIFVDDISFLHSEAEYLEMFPEFISIEFESLTKFHNGYYLRVCNLTTTQTDLALRYALRTGDTSFLTDTELTVYRKLFSIAEELQLEELKGTDAILAVHDYLIINTDYDTIAATSSTPTASHYAEGLLLNNLAVCSGYASTFQLLMYLANIPCEYVFTDTHAWNLVQLEDEWYHIDVTWDDPAPDRPDTVIYTYFMMTDAEISVLEDHQNWHCECGLDHNCDDESYRIYPYRNYLCSNETEAALLIEQQAATGNITLVYPADGTLTEDFLLQSALDILQRGFEYFPSDSINGSHYLLQIFIN